MTIKVLQERGATGSEIARLLGVSEGAVRYHVRRMKAGVAERLDAGGNVKRLDVIELAHLGGMYRPMCGCPLGVKVLSDV